MRTTTLMKSVLGFVFAMLIAEVAYSDEDIGYIAGVSVGLRDVEFRTSSISTGVGAALADIRFDETVYVAMFSATAFYEGFYLAAQYDLLPQSGTTTLDVNVGPAPGGGEPLTPGNDGRSSDFDRVDFNLTAGFNGGNGWSFFGGYKYTRWDLEALEFNFLFQNKDQQYIEKGLFVGGSYTLDFNEAGALSLSLAYASLESEFSESNVPAAPLPPTEQMPFTFGEFEFSGTATGLSYGIQWSAGLADNWAYTVGLKFQDYKSKNGRAEQTVLPLPDPVLIRDMDTEHKDSTFSIGLMYIFD